MQRASKRQQTGRRLCRRVTWGREVKSRFKLGPLGLSFDVMVPSCILMELAVLWDQRMTLFSLADAFIPLLHHHQERLSEEGSKHGSDAKPRLA